MNTETKPVPSKEGEEKSSQKSPETVPREVAVSPVKQDEGSPSNISSSSPVPPPAPSPTNSVSNRSSATHPAPIMTNPPQNRPPSAASVHSNSSNGGAQRTTATSRRGGRTRCRSPPTMINRPGSAPPEPYTPSAVGDNRGAPPPPSPANPSAAAAAAAAAAKSITRNPKPPSSWYEPPDAGQRYPYARPSHRESSRYPPSSSSRYYEQQQHRNWPPPEDEPPSRSSSGRYRGRGPPPPHEDHYGYREGGYYRGGRTSGREPYHPYDDYDRRFQEHPPHHSAPRSAPYDDRRREHSTSPQPYDYRGGRGHHRREHPRDGPYYPKDPESRAESGAPHSVKRTTRVIGTAKPIHMPRASEPGNRGSRGGSAASVFRGRPGSDLGPSSRGEPVEEDSPQKILMALRTPSTSFEEKQPKVSNNPLSPEEPPQIQHSHNQGNGDSNLFFEPQRSPKSGAANNGPPQPTSSIDMAPSFSLFNQSFDSIGDTAQFFNVGGPLDSALQSTSFGAVPTGSDEKGGNELLLSASNGTFAQQLLGSSSGGALTFGMSPSNSFGGGVSSMGRGNMMLLGGQEHRAPSPSQLLDMYRSYSNGEGASPRPKRGSPLEDSHIRSTGGNLGAPSRFGEGNSGGQYGNSSRGGPHETDGSPSFYAFLKKYKDAFKECSFLMPALKVALLEAPDVKQEVEADKTPKRGRNPDPYGEPTPQDTAIAVRRIASAVCAFGGTIMGDRVSSSQKPSSNQSIFREKPGDTATVTPSSSTSTSPRRSRHRAKYDEQLPSRYYENDNRLSWEFEENPPIEDGEEEEDSDIKKEDGDNADKSKNGSSGAGNGKDGEDDEGDSSSQSTPEGGQKTCEGESGDQPKMRYRCKLCGQPKQNHTCPFQQSLARSIGAMVYPAVNAFTSVEPGILAPALSEMNNFMLSGSESVTSEEQSPSRPTPDRMHRMNQGPPSTAQVTPESMRGTPRRVTSPISNMSSGHATPQRSHTPGSSRRVRGHGMGSRYTPGSSSRKKRTHAQMKGDGQDDLLFVEYVDLKPEQFRIVTPSKAVSSPDAFTYPALPLPYAQRKRLSDNLFSLSKEVPQLTDECAAVLREAREKDLWDLAVAELMTQVVVVAHCRDGDARFDGLRRYLLTLGISC